MPLVVFMESGSEVASIFSSGSFETIVHPNRKRLLLSQLTLREEFVEKKYQVFDILDLLLILVQVNLPSQVERV